MTDWIWRVTARYGQNVSVQTGEETVSVRAFLQPVPERSERVRETVTPIGWVDGRMWQYLGQMALEAGDILTWNDLTFRVRSCRPYYIGDRLSHYWAALEREWEAAECGS